MKNKKLNDFEQQIKNHLDERSKSDVLFSEFYKNESKNIYECCNYIISEVKKEERTAFADSEIFDLAVHYYMENDLEVPKSIPNVVVKHSSSKVAPKPKKEKTKVETSTAQLGWVQPSLF